MVDSVVSLLDISVCYKEIVYLCIRGIGGKLIQKCLRFYLKNNAANKDRITNILGKNLSIIFLKIKIIRSFYLLDGKKLVNDWEWKFQVYNGLFNTEASWESNSRLNIR